MFFWSEACALPRQTLKADSNGICQRGLNKYFLRKYFGRSGGIGLITDSEKVSEYPSNTFSDKYHEEGETVERFTKYIKAASGHTLGLLASYIERNNLGEF